MRPAGLVLCVTTLALAAAACQTAPPDRTVEQAGTEEIAALDAFGARLADLQTGDRSGGRLPEVSDRSGLAALRSDLDRAAAQPGLSRQLLARVDAMRAEAALLAGDPGAARRHLAEAAGLSETEEGVWIVRAWLEGDPGKRLAVLEPGLAQADSGLRLRCERGEALLAAGRYAEAAQDLDEGLRGLGPGYERLYAADRDRALSLAQVARDSGGAPVPSVGLDAPLTIRSMVETTAGSSHLLDGVTPAPASTYGALLPGLKSAGLLLDPAAPPDAPATRKNVAWFLWGLVARLEHDPGLLTRYRQKYTVSPVPDVSPADPWFDAVLGTVEREIMDLPDGVHFRPDDPVTGLELVSMLARMKKLVGP
jgi:hypothetical protein